MMLFESLIFAICDSIVQVCIDQQATVWWWVDTSAETRFSQWFHFPATTASVHAGQSDVLVCMFKLCFSVADVCLFLLAFKSCWRYSSTISVYRHSMQCGCQIYV